MHLLPALQQGLDRMHSLPARHQACQKLRAGRENVKRAGEATLVQAMLTAEPTMAAFKDKQGRTAAQILQLRTGQVSLVGTGSWIRVEFHFTEGGPDMWLCSQHAKRPVKRLTLNRDQHHSLGHDTPGSSEPWCPATSAHRAGQPAGPELACSLEGHECLVGMQTCSGKVSLQAPDMCSLWALVFCLLCHCLGQPLGPCFGIDRSPDVLQQTQTPRQGSAVQGQAGSDTTWVHPSPQATTNSRH